MHLNEKQFILEFIKKLPDEVTLQDIQYHLYVLEKIKNAQKDIANGEIITHKEVTKKFNKNR